MLSFLWWGGTVNPYSRCKWLTSAQTSTSLHGTSCSKPLWLSPGTGEWTKDAGFGISRSQLLSQDRLQGAVSLDLLAIRECCLSCHFLQNVCNLDWRKVAGAKYSWWILESRSLGSHSSMNRCGWSFQIVPNIQPWHGTNVVKVGFVNQNGGFVNQGSTTQERMLTNTVSVTSTFARTAPQIHWVIGKHRSENLQKLRWKTES